LGVVGSNLRDGAHGEAEADEDGQVEDVVDEAGGGQFGRGVAAHHDGVGQPLYGHADLPHRDGEAQTDEGFVFLRKVVVA
jgi:hypothetical protein